MIDEPVPHIHEEDLTVYQYPMHFRFAGMDEGFDTPVLTITPDGRLELGPGLSEDEATQKVARLLLEMYSKFQNTEITNLQRALQETQEKYAFVVNELSKTNKQLSDSFKQVEALQNAQNISSDHAAGPTDPGA
jgi:hypothetical protein